MPDLSEEMKYIVNEFFIETEEILAKLDQYLVSLEKNTSDRGVMDAVFRAFHTIKGSAGFLGYEQMVEVVHRAENILNLLRQNEITFTPEINDLLLESADTVKALLGDAKENSSKKRNISQIVDKLDSVVNKKQETLTSKKKGGKKKGAKKETKEKKTSEVSHDEGSIGEILLEEGSITEDQLNEALVEQESAPKLGEILVKKQAVSEEKVKKSLERQTKIRQTVEEQTIRVDIKRLDNVMNLVGELVLNRNQLANLQLKLEKKHQDDELIEHLSYTSAHLNLVTTDLQSAVMKARMQPIKKLFGKFPRMVRDLAREKNKKINLIISGESTELDKSIIEEIVDPLVHIIRNSVDHGIESIDLRKKYKKPETGVIKLSAYQKGNNIVIEIEDDGKGIDVKKIGEKAAAKGLVNKMELEDMSEKNILNFIFLPGFSTAEVVTDMSGRGVGMDVVKTNIMKLGGIIDIETEVGKGLKIYIKLPITVAIIQSLMVRVDKEVFAIPLTSVIEIMKISKEKIQTIERREVVKIRDTVLPLIRLKDEFNLSDSNNGNNGNGSKNKRLYAVIIGFAEKQIGVVVEDLLGQQEVVIKSMGQYLSKIEGLAGATIDGDGKVVLILDIASLFKSVQNEISMVKA